MQHLVADGIDRLSGGPKQICVMEQDHVRLERVAACVFRKQLAQQAADRLEQRRAQIIVVQAVPYGLLGAGGDSKWRQVLGVVKVTEIACDRELEGATLVRGWIPFPQAAHAECVAFPLDFRSSHAAGELRVELPPICERERSRRNERETFNMLWVLEQIEHCEQPAPGIAAERHALSADVQAECIALS